MNKNTKTIKNLFEKIKAKSKRNYFSDILEKKSKQCKGNMESNKRSNW